MTRTDYMFLIGVAFAGLLGFGIALYDHQGSSVSDHQGELNRDCKSNGSCLGSLSCRRADNGLFSSPVYKCLP